MHYRSYIRSLHVKLGTWRKVAEELKFGSAGYWCGVSKNDWKPSRAAKQSIREYLKMEDNQLPIISARVDQSLIDAYDNLARERDRSRSYFVVRALKQYLEILKTKEEVI